MIRFVAGIDTDVGKSIATGLMARHLISCGRRVVTQKIAQTGCTGHSEDIAMHRKLMGTSLCEEDRRGDTCPYVFKLAASPHLAAHQAGVRIDTAHIDRATERLAARYDDVLVEGVGGLMVPLNDDVTLLDYVAERRYPVVLVTSPRLGSINHTLLSLEALRVRHVPLRGLVYNRFIVSESVIVEDSRMVFADAIAKAGYDSCSIIDMPGMSENPDVDAAAFAPLFA